MQFLANYPLIREWVCLFDCKRKKEQIQEIHLISCSIEDLFFYGFYQQ